MAAVVGSPDPAPPTEERRMGAERGRTRSRASKALGACLVVVLAVGVKAMRSLSVSLCWRRSVAHRAMWC